MVQLDCDNPQALQWYFCLASVTTRDSFLRTGKSYCGLCCLSDIFDECDIETKKMILSRIMKSVRVNRDYEIEIDFTVDCEQFGLNLNI